MILWFQIYFAWNLELKGHQLGCLADSTWVDHTDFMPFNLEFLVKCIPKPWVTLLPYIDLDESICNFINNDINALWAVIFFCLFSFYMTYCIDEGVENQQNRLFSNILILFLTTRKWLVLEIILMDFVLVFIRIWHNPISNF